MHFQPSLDDLVYISQTSEISDVARYIGVVRGDQHVARKCYVQSVRCRPQKKETLSRQTDKQGFEGGEESSHPGGGIEKTPDRCTGLGGPDRGDTPRRSG